MLEIRLRRFESDITQPHFLYLSGSKTSTRLYAALRWLLVNEPAQDIAASDRGLGYHLGVGSRIGRAKLEAPMRPGSVVMLGVRAEDVLQVTTAEDQDVVEALSSSGADPALADAVRLRRADGGSDMRRLTIPVSVSRRL
jgi:hypothetical protein